MGFDFDKELGQQLPGKIPGKWAVVCEEYKSQKQKRRKNRCKEQAAAAAQAAAQQQKFTDVTPAQAKHRKEYRDASVTCLTTEVEHGNVEYKYKIGCITNENRQQQLITQMKFRLSEGNGECFYYIGVEDDGYPRGLDPQELATSISMLSRMAASLQATARLVEYRPGGFGRTAALLHLKENAEEDMRATEIRVAVAGSMDSGKSTLVAVLTQGADGRPLLDNGRGSARMPVFRHKHEIESGRTSSISHQVLGYDDMGRVLNYRGVAAPTPADITAAAAQVLNFLDMGGHEKYLKTTLYGFTCMLPDYVLLCIDAPSGVTPITREHLAVAVALEIPTALIITKTDAVDAQQLQNVLQEVQLLMAPVLHSSRQRQQLFRPGAWRPHEQPEVLHAKHVAAPGDLAVGASVELNVDDGQAAAPGPLGPGLPVVRSTQQAAELASKLTQLHRCTAAAAASFQQVTYPVFLVSCVNGQGLSRLHDFLSRLKPATSSCSPCQGGEPLGGPLGGGSSSAGHAGAACGHASEVALQQLQASDQPEHLQWAPGAPVLAPGSGVAAGSSALLAVDSSSQLWVTKEHCATCASSSTVTNRKVPDVPAGAAAAGHFQVVHTFDVEGVGWVVSGIAVSGTFEVGQQLLWGPTSDGGFSPVSVSCIQRSHLPVRQVQAGQTATLALQPPGAMSTFAHSKEALMSAAVAAQAAAEEEAAREAAAAAAAANIAFGAYKRCPQPVHGTGNGGRVVGVTGLLRVNSRGRSERAAADLLPDSLVPVTDELATELRLDGNDGDIDDNDSGFGGMLDPGDSDFDGLGSFTGFEEDSSRGRSSGRGNSNAVLGPFVDDLAAAAAVAASFSSVGASCSCRSSSTSEGTNSSISPSSSWCTGLEDGVQGGNSSNKQFTEVQFGAVTTAIETADGAASMALADPPAALQVSSVALASSPVVSATAVGAKGDGAASQGDAGIQPTRSMAMPNTTVKPGSSSNSSMISSSRGRSRSSHNAPLQLGCSPPKCRSKGAVLLGTAVAPHTYWEFEALLVLLGGHWPARGLLSGCWPPDDMAQPAEGRQPMPDASQLGRHSPPGHAAASGAPGDSGKTDQGVPSSASEGAGIGRVRVSGRQRTKRCDYAYVIHCNSIRQIARVMSMQEVRQEQHADDRSEGEESQIPEQQQHHHQLQLSMSAHLAPGDAVAHGGQPQQLHNLHCKNPCVGRSSSSTLLSSGVPGWGLSASIQAAAALLQSTGTSGGNDRDTAGWRNPVGERTPSGSSSSRWANRRLPFCSDLGTVVSVRFRFTHRPEWLQAGARLIARDRSDGHVAAAGFVTQLLDAHQQQQSRQQLERPT